MHVGVRRLVTAGIWAALLLVALVAIARGWVSPGTIAPLAVGAMIGTFRSRRVRAKEQQFWSEVWEARASALADRLSRIEQIEDPGIRERVASILARDGEEAVEGDVERFPFPAGLIRIYGSRYWVFWGLAGVMLVVSAIPSVGWLQLLALGLAVLFGAAAWHSSRAEQSLKSVVEVTPFRLTELWPDGRSRTILFNWSLELRNEPEKRCVILTPAGTDDGIVLDYRRLGFARLLDCVVLYGKFRPDDSLPPTT